MAADAGTRSKHVHPRMMVRQPDRLPDVDADALGDQRELIGQGDIDVAERVLHHLDHLGRGRVGAHDLALDEGRVQVGGALGASRGEATGQTIVLLELDQDAAWQHPFGTVGDEDVKTGSQAGFSQDRGEQVARRAWRDSGFEHDEIAAAQQRRDLTGGALNVAQISTIGQWIEGRRHRDDECVGGRRARLDAQSTRVDRGGDQRLQLWLVDRGLTILEGRLHPRARIDADDVLASQGEHAAGRQADIAQAEQADRVHVEVSCVPE